ncbi:restriction endonuclease subunit S [Aeromonas salmonicida]|uniref:restriction endonuclease subunit S n=1 Tax=Aeromonas salmonicida TaxID=645 RepID=UPI0029AA6308|nr:restriction endonuclease subunit S [Aeromonas salmonicida]
MSRNENRHLVPLLRFPEFRDTGVWETEYGYEVFEQISNKNHNSDLPVLAITQEHGAIPRSMIDYHVSVTDKSLESYKVVDVGDFIISLRSFQGGIEFSKYRGICSPAYVILRLKSGHSKDYFRHYLKTERFISQMTKNLEGLRDGKMISYKQFSVLNLPIPSREEQQKIADSLSSLDELIIEEVQKLKALKTYKRALLQKLFPCENDTIPRLRFPEFLGEEEWEKVALGDIAEIKLGKMLDSKKQSTGTLLPYLNNLSVRWNEIDTLNLPRMCFDDDELERFGLRTGDVVVCEGGEPGRSAVWDGRLPNIKFQKAIHRVRFNVPFEPCLLVFYLESIAGTPRFEKLFTGGGIKHLTREAFTQLKIPVTSYDEQTRIASCLSSLENMITGHTQKISALKIQQRGLAQKLFPDSLDEALA